MENKNRIIHFEECTKTNISILLDCAPSALCFIMSVWAQPVHCQLGYKLSNGTSTHSHEIVPNKRAI